MWPTFFGKFPNDSRSNTSKCRESSSIGTIRDVPQKRAKEILSNPRERGTPTRQGIRWALLEMMSTGAPNAPEGCAPARGLLPRLHPFGVARFVREQRAEACNDANQAGFLEICD